MSFTGKIGDAIGCTTEYVHGYVQGYQNGQEVDTTNDVELDNAAIESAATRANRIYCASHIMGYRDGATGSFPNPLHGFE